MSKKRFTSGIDQIMNDDASYKLSDFSNDTPAVTSSPRKPTGKRFVTHLDTLLNEVYEDPFFSESSRRDTVRTTQGKSKTEQGNGYRAPVTGLDALIRQTLVQIGDEQEDDTRRRISLVVDRTKLDRLKTIARMEGAFMKDIIGGLIEAYVLKYSSEKGVDI
jgi:hypothetical protein